MAQSLRYEYLSLPIDGWLFLKALGALLNNLSKKQILHLIPHQGKMNLLDEVMDISDTSLRAVTTCHRQAMHPLAVNGQWPIHTVLEIAAQAMAVHGALQNITSRSHPPVQQAFVGAVSKMEVHQTVIPTRQAKVCVVVERESNNKDSAYYHFYAFFEDNNTTLAEGKALVLFSR